MAFMASVWLDLVATWWVRVCLSEMVLAGSLELEIVGVQIGSEVWMTDDGHTRCHRTKRSVR